LDDQAPPITTDEQVLAYANPYLSVYDDRVRLPDGTPGRYLRIVERDGMPGVAALALHAGRIALVKVFRYPIGSWEWGIPRGFAHSADPVESLTAELLEELGAVPARIEPLVVVTPNSGILASRVHIFLAHYEQASEQPIDVGEVGEVRWPTLTALAAEVAGGGIQDAFTLAALGAYYARGL